MPFSDYNLNWKKEHLMIPRSSKFTTGKRAPATISHEDQYATSFNYRYKPFKSIILHKEQWFNLSNWSLSNSLTLP